MSRSAMYTANTGAQVIAVGGTIAPGGIVRRFGCGIDLNGNAINITEPGYYAISASVTAEPTAAGTVTATLFDNGVAVPGATASATAAAAGDPVNMDIEAVVRITCRGNTGALSFVLEDAAATITNIAVVVEKL